VKIRVPITDFKRHFLLYIYWILFFLQIPITAIIFRENTNNGTILYAVIDICFLFIYLIKHNKNTLGNYIIKLHPLALYLAWCTISIFWSISNETFYNISLVLKDTIRLIIALLMLSTYEKNAFILNFFRAIAVSALLFGVFTLVSIDYIQEYNTGAHRAMYEGYKDAVGVGRQASFIFLLLFSGYFTGYIKKTTFFISGTPCFLIALFAFSKSSLIALFISMYISFMSVNKNYRFSIKNMMLNTLILLLATVTIVYIRSDYLISYITAQGGNNLMTYSGRTVIWDELLSHVDSTLIYGYGLNPVYELVMHNPLLKASTAHNEILQQVLSYGWIGLIFWCFVHFKYYNSYRHCVNRAYAQIMQAVLIFYMIAGFMESVLVLSIFPVYFIALFWILGLNKKYYKTEEYRAFEAIR